MAEQCVVNTPEQACQAQALASIAREWPGQSSAGPRRRMEETETSGAAEASAYLID
jgi:hypothetical protein